VNRPAVVLAVRGLGRGGAERLVAHEAADLAARGWPVAVWYQVGGEFVADLAAAGLPPVRVGLRGARRRMRALAAEHGAVVVHTHSPRMGAALRLAAVGLRAVSFVHTEHNLVSSYRWPTRVAHRATAGRIRSLVAVSDAVLVAAPRVADRRVLHHVDLETDRLRRCLTMPFREAGDDLTVLCVASFTTKKDHANLFAAVRLLELDRLLRVRVVGDGTLQEEIESGAAAVNAGSDGVQVELLGVRDDVDQLLAAADVLVLPSRSEGLPLIVVEAMAANTPVVATAVGGVPELIDDGTTGLLVPAGDPQALADALARALGDVELRRRLATAAREVVLSWDSSPWTDVYDEILLRAAQPPSR
jgi:glycosyltransferase involved in cell wall biosynthesis